MEWYHKIDVNLYAFITLGIFTIIAFTKLNRKEKRNVVFLISSIIVLVQLIFESLTVMINGVDGLGILILTNILHISLFISAPLLSYIYFRFIIRTILTIKFKSFIIDCLLIIPLIITLVVVLLTPFFDLVFSFNSENIYHREAWFFVIFAITYLYIIVSSIILILNHRRIPLKEKFPFLIIAIVPIIGGLLQGLIYGIFTMWSSVALCLIIIFIFFQERFIQLDYLSGAWTRESFVNFIRKEVKKPMAMAYFDIDSLKSINDIYGHKEGDLVIIKFCNLLKAIMSPKDLFVRMGGDEFILALDSIENRDIKNVIAELDMMIRTDNLSTKKAYQLAISYGADTYYPEQESLESFIYKIDSKMYLHKQEKKINKSVEGQNA
jgi:diguanylate cyclase (GGDEF)-like protein